jgi:hypothetical protein
MRVFDEADLPCAVGESPFRIKGVAYQHTFGTCDKAPGGREAVLAAIPSRAGREYLAQTFLASAWYDVLPMVWLDAATAHVRGLPPELALRNDSIDLARTSLRGIYKSMLQILSSATVASVLPRLMNTYYSFTSSRAERVGPTEVHAVVAGMPALLRDWYMVSGTAFGEEALALSGTKSPSLVWLPPKPSGMKDRFALNELTCRITWS